MATPNPSMLWEAMDANIALAQRFRFVSAEEAARWLAETVLHTYGMHVTSVDRLVISSYNLLAWLSTSEGRVIAKCCAFTSAHPRLLALGRLVVWLQQQDLPVSAPLPANNGEVQVACDHRSLSVQRLIQGNLLDPSHLEQALSAGVTLAHLHKLLAVYPQAHDFTHWHSVSSLKTAIVEWLQKKRATIDEPQLVAAIQTLAHHLQSLDDTELRIQAIHHDYRAANILWNEGRICAVLDFEELRNGRRVNELAWAAVHLGTRFHNWGPVSIETHNAFLAGYQTHLSLTKVEQAWLPLLLLWHSANLACSAVGGPTYAACLDATSAYTRLLGASWEK